MPDEKHGATANHKAQADEPGTRSKPSSDTSSSTRRNYQTRSDSTNLKSLPATENSHAAAQKHKLHDTHNTSARDRDVDTEQSKTDKQRTSKTGHHETSQKNDPNELSEGNKKSSLHNTNITSTAKKLIKPQRSAQSSQIPNDSETFHEFPDSEYELIPNEYLEILDYAQRQDEEPAGNNALENSGPKRTSVTISPEPSPQTAQNDFQQESPNDGPTHGAETVDRGRTPTEIELVPQRGISTASSYARMTTGNKPSNSSPPNNRAQHGPPSEASSDGAKDTAKQAQDDSRSKSLEAENATGNEISARSTHETSSATVGGIVSSILGFRSNPMTREAQLSKDLHIAKKHIQAWKRETSHAQEHCERLAYELQRVSVENRAHARNVNTLGHENQRFKEMIEGLQLELRAVTKKYEDAKLLSDTRGKELHGAQMFLTKADSLSVSELVQKVNALNEEIFQAAASLGDFLVRTHWDISEEDLHTRQKGSSDVLGSPLVQILITETQKRDEPANPLLVQITLQVLLAAFCASMIRTWSHDESADSYLRKLYEQIRNSSDQAVSGRWRALTQAQLKHDTERWTKFFRAKLIFVLSTAAWNVQAQEHRQSFEARLPTIFKAVADVRTSLGEKFTSADIEVAIVGPGSQFQKVVMEEAYGEDGQDRGSDNVLATIGLGLKKFVPPSPNVAAHCETILPPKVIVESSLRAALNPSPYPVRSRVKRKVIEK